MCIRDSGRPLLAEYQVVTLPSATLLSLLRRELAGRPPAPKLLAMVASPVFRLSDPRIPAPVREALRSRGSNDWLVPELLPALPATRREADAILSLVPPEQRLAALDFDANLELVQSGRLAEYRILHFASHGFLHTEHPELSGLVLSLLDHRGNPRDGSLPAHEIEPLYLPAELVVLSACDTALGKEIRGEGLVGLTQAFFIAGARRVVVSQWSVHDAATAELMTRFYRHLLDEGLAPPEALRRAQLGLAENDLWSAPYFWAGFGLQGDWR